MTRKEAKKLCEILNADNGTNLTPDKVLRLWKHVEAKSDEYLRNFYKRNKTFEGKEEELEEFGKILQKSLVKFFNELFSDTTIQNTIAHEHLSLVFSGKASNVLARARTIGKFDPLSRRLSVEGVNIFSPDGINKIGVGTAKLFRRAVEEFTKQNQQNAPKEKIEYRVSFDVKEYAERNGIINPSADTMKNFRRKLKKECETLRASGLDWSEKIKGKPQTFSGINYIGAYKITGDKVIIEFTQTMAEYLVLLPLLNYPPSLYLIDDRNYNAFVIGEAMALHYGQDNNIIRKTENRLKVKNLLKYTSFPDYDTLKKQESGWGTHVKEPFLVLLGELRKCGFLKHYSFFREGIELSEDEVWRMDSYEEFIELIIEFEINDSTDHRARALDIAKKKAERTKKCNEKKKKDKKKKEDEGKV